MHLKHIVKYTETSAFVIRPGQPLSNLTEGGVDLLGFMDALAS